MQESELAELVVRVMDTFEFTVSHRQVSTNCGYRRGKGRGMYKTREMKEFQKAIREECKLRWGERECDKKSKWFVGITFYYPSVSNDIDGAIKPTLDALEGIVFDNDKQVVMLYVQKKRDRNNPRTDIVIRRVEHE